MKHLHTDLRHDFYMGKILKSFILFGIHIFLVRNGYAIGSR
jgi:hypothetical protein